MPDTFLTYANNPYQYVATTAAVPTAWADVVPTTTAPTEAVVARSGSPAREMLFIPMGTYTTQTGIGVRVIGYSRHNASNGVLWFMPTILGAFTLTPTTATKPTYTIGGVVLTPFAIATVTANYLTNVAPRLYSTPAAGNLAASIALDLQGSEFVQFQWQASATLTGACFCRYL